MVLGIRDLAQHRSGGGADQRRQPLDRLPDVHPSQSRSSSLIEVLERVCASTRFTITAQ